MKRYTVRITDPALIRYLDAQPNASNTIRQAITNHVHGKNGISLLSISDRLDRLEQLLRSGISVNPSQSAPIVEGDGLNYIDEMGK